ncbi:MAG: TonB family protein [Acidobacteria bacterium]|nr:TonB family protein [Acidobacteriota bacterium]
MRERFPIRWLTQMLAVAVTLALLAGSAAGRTPGSSKAPASEGPRLAEEKTGSVPTREGLRLRLVADFGNVRILTTNSIQVSYKVRIETDARAPDAQSLLKRYVFTARSSPAGVQLTGESPSHDTASRLTVSFEVQVPRRYNLDVLTQGGNIETQDIDGRVSLVTHGGNITAGRIGGGETTGGRSPAASGTPVARLETSGGHIAVLDVSGDLRATTAGGHITTANVQGDAYLRTGGGHIRAGKIGGTAQLETGGGNISVQRASARVTATTGGGQIDFGEAAGSIRARTGGGGIRVLRVAGAMQLETGGGSIFLTKVQGAVRASTGAGTITAWFLPEEEKSGSVEKQVGRTFRASQLESGQGDIVVYLPRELPITIEAIIEMSTDYRIEADLSLPLKLSYLTSGPGARAIRGECSLNGGGETLRLKTAAGNIRLKYSDTDAQAGLNRQQMDQLRQRMAAQQRRLEEMIRQQQKEIQSQVEQQFEKAVEKQKLEEREPGRLGEWQRKIEGLWWGGLRVNSEAQQKKLVHQVQPAYPDVAKQAGVQGTVVLKVFIGKDGDVQEVKVLSGEPVLAEAAADAVRRWRYQPTVLDGKLVNVVTTVTVEFRLK